MLVLKASKSKQNHQSFKSLNIQDNKFQPKNVTTLPTAISAVKVAAITVSAAMVWSDLAETMVSVVMDLADMVDMVAMVSVVMVLVAMDTVVMASVMLDTVAMDTVAMVSVAMVSLAMEIMVVGAMVDMMSDSVDV